MNDKKTKVLFELNLIVDKTESLLCLLPFLSLSLLNTSECNAMRSKKGKSFCAWIIILEKNIYNIILCNVMLFLMGYSHSRIFLRHHRAVDNLWWCFTLQNFTVLESFQRRIERTKKTQIFLDYDEAVTWCIMEKFEVA